MSNEVFNAFMNTQFMTESFKKGRDLMQYNLIDIGVITDVTDGKCTVQSFLVEDGKETVYTSLELVFPGNVGSYSPEGMLCLVLFPPEMTNLKENTISTLSPYFSAFGGKVIPIATIDECKVLVGPDENGAFNFESNKVKLTISDDELSLDLNLGTGMSLSCSDKGITAWLANSSIYISVDFTTCVERKVVLSAENKPVQYHYSSLTETWVGWYSWVAWNSTDKPIDSYIKTEFKFVNVFLPTEEQVLIHNTDGEQICCLIIDNTGELYVSTEEKITVEAKKDVTVDRDGTKLEVKNGKVVVTGDLEVSGKTTITGMKTDVQKFFDDLTSALNSMFTIGSPATHQTDGGFKSNIAILRAKL